MDECFQSYPVSGEPLTRSFWGLVFCHWQKKGWSEFFMLTKLFLLWALGVNYPPTD